MKKTILTNRQDMAKALNFGKFKVLTYNVDTEKGSTGKVIKSTRRYGDMERQGTLYCGKQTADDGIFYLINRPAMLTATVSVYDWLRSADDANSPVIYEGNLVAILVYSEKTGESSIEIVRALKPTPEYSTSLTFESVDPSEVDLSV